MDIGIKLEMYIIVVLYNICLVGSFVVEIIVGIF